MLRYLRDLFTCLRWELTRSFRRETDPTSIFPPIDESRLPAIPSDSIEVIEGCDTKVEKSFYRDVIHVKAGDSPNIPYTKPQRGEK